MVSRGAAPLAFCPYRMAFLPRGGLNTSGARAASCTGASLRQDLFANSATNSKQGIKGSRSKYLGLSVAGLTVLVHGRTRDAQCDECPLGTHQHFASQYCSCPCLVCNAVDKEVLRARNKATALKAVGACNLAVSLLSLAAAASISEDLDELEQSIPMVKEECHELKKSLQSAHEELEVAVRLSTQELELRQESIKQIMASVSNDFARLCYKCDLAIQRATQDKKKSEFGAHVGAFTAMLGIAVTVLSLGCDCGAGAILGMGGVGVGAGHAIVSISNIDRCRMVIEEISSKLRVTQASRDDLNEQYWYLMGKLAGGPSCDLAELEPCHQ